jgi:PST family polysaccharide transporter
MIGQMLGAREVGLFSAALRISEAWYFVPMAIANSAMPAIIEAKAISEALYHERLRKLFRTMTFMAYAIAIPVTIFAQEMITMLYGPAFMQSGLVLTIHIWAGVFVALGVARGAWILSEGLTRYSFATTIIGASINIVMNYFLIPIYGIKGAAVATVVAQIFASYAANAFYQRTRVIFIEQSSALFWFFRIKPQKTS